MSRGDQGLDEIRIVVERGGFGQNKWRWRLANDGGLAIGLGSGFKSAEDAYRAGHQRMLDLRAGKEAERMVGTARR